MTDEDATPTPRCDQVWREAHRIAHLFGHTYLGVEHVFLAIIRDRHAVPTQVLGDITDLDDLDERLVEFVRSYDERHTDHA